MTYTTQGQITAVLAQNKLLGNHIQETDLSSIYTISTLAEDYNGVTPTHVIMQVNGGTARFTLDGTNPSPSLGFFLPDGAMVTIPSKGMEEIKIVLSNSTPTLEAQVVA